MRPAAYVLAVALVAGAASPGHGAGMILYATAASQQRVDGFCVRRDGGLAPTPSVQIATAGIEPRRLLVAGGVLYVAELNQVEAFEIGAQGGLKKRGHTEVLKKKETGNNMEAVDIATSPDGSLLYVAERGPDQVVAYSIPLASDEQGSQLTSCIQGESNADFLALAVHAGLLYVAGAGQVRGVNVFVLNADGSLPAPPANCLRSTSTQDRSEPTVPLSCRKRLDKPRGMVIDETSNILYVEDKTQSRVFAFALQPDGTFSPAPATCLQGSRKKKEQQKPLNKTDMVLPYQSLLLSHTTLFGIQFEHGRIDAYHLSDGKLSLQPTRDFADVRMTPVRGAISADGGVLYLGGGELDGVRAFHLNKDDGMLAETDFFSETDSQPGSFPNDVAVAMVSDSCP